MGTLTTTTLLADVAKILQDEAAVRWTGVELLEWLNEAQAVVVTAVPSSNIKTEAYLLPNAGRTHQTLPTGGILLHSLVVNLGADGGTYGQAIRRTTREVLDSSTPGWHNDTNLLGLITHYVYDESDPKNFFVNPKAPATAWYVQIKYTKLPAIMSAGAAIEVDDIYRTALINYVLFRAFSKEDEPAANEKAAAYRQLFEAGLKG